MTKGMGCVTLTVPLQLIQLIQPIQLKQVVRTNGKGAAEHVWNADFYGGGYVDHVLRGCGGHAGAVAKAEISAGTDRQNCLQMRTGGYGQAELFADADRQIKTGGYGERRRGMSLFAMGLFAIIGAAAVLVIAVVIASRR